MIGLFCFALAVLASPFRSKLRLEAENAVLRHQLNVLRRRPRGRVRLTNRDRWFFIQLYRWFPAILKVLAIIRPETLVRWHRAGFRCYWRWKSRPRGGRPQIETELRVLIRRMSVENPLWGAASTANCSSLGLRSRSRASPSTWSNDVGRTGHWIKMHQSLAEFSKSETSNHTPSSADFTTTTPELKFSVHTRRPWQNRGRKRPPVPVGNSILLATDIESGDAPALCERFVA
jgi:hypothetical protein